jgi:glycosyltransferase involved in cell wall biosynthesis
MPPLVSVVMAAKNYARFLPVAVESVLAQSFADWELLIVDDGSTDATPAAARPFLADARVRYFRADRLGQPRAKNLGIGLARGEFVAFLDADDAWEPTKLEKQLALFRDNPDVGVVFCGRSLIDEKGNTIAARPTPTPPYGRVLPAMFVQNFVCFSSAVVRRDVFSHVGAFDPQWDLAIDFDLWLRVAKHHGFDFVDEALVKYRTGHGNLSKKLLDRVDTAMSIMDRACARYGVATEVSGEVVAEGYASTCRTMGYVLRESEPREAAKWYLRALAWSGGRLVSAKGLVASVLRMLGGKRAAGSPENASANR